MEQKTFLMGNKELPVRMRPVVEYATHQIMTNGIRNFTVEKLCTDLKISKKTIYKYFRSKEEFVEEVLYHSFRQLFDSVKAIKTYNHDPLRRVFLILSTIQKQISLNSAEFIYDVRLYYPKIWKEVEDFETRTIVSLNDCLVKAQNMGLIRKDINLKFTITLIMKIVQTVFQPELLVQAPYSVSDIMKVFVDIVMNGLMEKGKSFDSSFIGEK